MTQGNVLKIEFKRDGGSIVVYNSAWAEEGTATATLTAEAPKIVVEEGRLSREEAKRQYWPFLEG